jgi:hypothetical protein
VAAAVLTCVACGGAVQTSERPPLLDVRAATESKEPSTTGSGDGAAPRKPEPERAPIEDTSKKTASLETAAYTDNDHVTVFTPSVTGSVENVVDGASIRGSYLVDVVSAASVDILATATKRWTEVRHAGVLSGTYKPHDLGVGFSGSASSEPDYFSFGAAGHLSYDLNEKNTALFAGYGFGRDTAGRHGTPFAVFARTLTRGSFLAGVDQVIDHATLASFSGSLIIENGDQSKPYRYIPLFSPEEAANVPKGASIDYVNAHRTFERPLEQLPLSRKRYAIAADLAHRFETSTIRASERFYFDSWGVKASTTDARWFFDVGTRVRVWPHLRFHGQSSVVFWQRAYVSNASTGWDLPLYRTGDRELGPLVAFTGGAGAKFFLGSDAHPRFIAISPEIDAIYTSYLDDLYITSRTGILGTLTFEVGEEQ